MKKTWTLEQAQNLFNQSFIDLVFQAQTVHRKNFKANELQVSTLLSIKTGTCPENCSYCPQSGHYKTGLEKQKLMSLKEVVQAAQAAKANGSDRFCMGAAWRGPNEKDLQEVCDMIAAVKNLGLETCATLGLLQDGQAETLKKAGLDFYNHNIDTSPEYYEKVISTRNFQDRLDTLYKVRDAGLKVCCGGIIGMGETQDDRLKMLVVLANLSQAPESVPLNQLIPIPGTPLANQAPVDSFEFIKTVAVARIMMPGSFIRLSAGREQMSDEMQAFCFMAGVNSIFYGQKLLTANNPKPDADVNLLTRLGLKSMSSQEAEVACE